MRSIFSFFLVCLNMNYINKHLHRAYTQTHMQTLPLSLLLSCGDDERRLWCVGVHGTCYIRIQSIETILIAWRDRKSSKLVHTHILQLTADCVCMSVHQFSMACIFRIWRVYRLLRSSTYSHATLAHTTNGSKKRKTRKNYSVKTNDILYFTLLYLWIVRGTDFFSCVCVCARSLTIAEASENFLWCFSRWWRVEIIWLYACILHRGRRCRRRRCRHRRRSCCYFLHDTNILCTKRDVRAAGATERADSEK